MHPLGNLSLQNNQTITPTLNLPYNSFSSLSPQQNDKSSYEGSLANIEAGLRDIIVLGKKGASKKYTPIFKDMLDSLFQIRRGSALVFKSGARSKQTQNESVSALVEATPEDLVNKPIGKCTATQLGHFVAYLILKSQAKNNSD